MALSVLEYVREDGSNPYRTWFNGLDVHAATKIAAATARLEMGNTSRLKRIGAISEYRIDWGPGYRIYLALDGDALVILLGGGTKRGSAGRHQTRNFAVDRVSGAEGRREGGSSEGQMALTRDFKQTVVERVKREPAFARALLDEAATLFLNGEPETARLLLRDLVNATVGFEGLAAATGKPSKSLHRMLSTKGNPSMDNLAAIITVVRKKLRVDLEAHTIKAA